MKTRAWPALRIVLGISALIPVALAHAAAISNTASASYLDPAATAFVTRSNTVAQDVTGLPTVGLSFSPSPVANSGTSTLRIMLTNPNASPLTGVSFTDIFPTVPGAMTVASPLNSTNSCGGALQDGSGGALDAGDDRVQLVNGQVPAAGSCTITVDVTAAVNGTYIDTVPAGALATAQGVSNVAAASAQLVMGIASPTASLSFSPGSILSGGVSTLTLTLANPGTTNLTAIALTDVFPASPAAMTVAALANLSNTCGGTLDENDPADADTTIDAGDGQLRLGGATLAAGASCTISVDVTAAAAGTYTDTLAAGAITTAEGVSNSASASGALSVAIAASPASVAFYQYAPGNPPGSVSSRFDGGAYGDAGGSSFAPLAPPTSGGAPISLATPVSVRASPVFHADDPIFITLADANRNTDASTRDFITLTVTASTGDTEILRLQETGPDTGVFAAVIQSGDASQANAPYDGALSVDINSRMTVSYVDPTDAGDSVNTSALVDPFGIVFDAATGLGVGGATVLLFSVDNNAPASVFCDDGVTPCPNSLATPATPTVHPQLGPVPAGGFRFPSVAPGQYRLLVTPPPGYGAPSVSNGPFPNDPFGAPYSVLTGSHGEPFTVPAGPAVNLDYPVDPAGLLLNKAVSQTLSGVGDFLQYRLSLQNLTAVAVTNTVVTDRMPEGFRYQAGSLRLNGAQAADPAISADGRTLTIPVGGVAIGQTAQLTYVLLVSAGARSGSAVNSARAAADGPTVSNVAAAAVEVRDILMQSHFTIVGEIACHAAAPAAAPLACPAAASVAAAPAGTYTVRAQFDSGKTSLTAKGEKELQALAVQLKGKDVERIEVTGHTDTQRLARKSARRFHDNYGISKARAATVGEYLARALGLSQEHVSAQGMGADEPLASNSSAAGRAQNRRTEVRVFERAAAAATAVADACPVAPAPTATPAVRKGLAQVRVLLDDGTYVTSDHDGLFHFEGVREGTHVVQLDLDSLPPGYSVVPRVQNTRHAGRAWSQFVDVKGGGLWRADFEACPAAGAASEPAGRDRAYEHSQRQRHAAADDPTAAGANIDFLAGQEPGVAWLYPAEDYVPRAGATRIAIKHLPGQVVTLRYIQGEDVSGLSFEGTQLNAAGTVAVSVWRGVPITEGSNRFEAQVIENGQVVQHLERRVNYSSVPARAELVPAESELVADGVHKPVVAVRIFDASGRPVRSGTTGGYRINPPYVPAQLQEQMQQRQLAGPDRFEPTWRIEGDEGVAYIELAPTGDAGTLVLNFDFQPTPQSGRKQELRAWLEAPQRDWIVVGFASGTVGYDTLKGNAQPLPGANTKDGTYTDGQVSLYAKGRVLGKWLLTLAYDSDKPEEKRRRQSLLSTIDPQAYYTLYGDGAGQGHDAASQDKLYLKLERDQFYALFGDYETGLTQTTLSRYSRTLSGLKAEYGGGGPLQATVFAADTPLNFARDELQGDGTSGLYHLRTGGIVLNSERLRLETRDRFHSERVLQSRALARHLDYDIDYDAGTLFFREPVNSRDSSFNPVFIVAEYETYGAADQQLNAGGRIGATALDGRLNAGATAIHDHSSLSDGNLGGLDAKLKLAGDTELRAEVAASDTKAGTLNRQGSAYLIEAEHHSAQFDALAYARRQAPAFGLNQQNLSEAGTDKKGVDGRITLAEHLSLHGQAWRQENLASDATRDAAASQLEYRTDAGSVRLGGLYARDEAGAGALAGRRYESQQLTAAGNRYFLDRKLELSGQADHSLGGSNDSVDYPSRYALGASYALTDAVRLLLAEEYTDGQAFDSLMTRVGLQATPWKGARLTSTLNQVDLREYGPRSFALFGLTQSLLLGERWGVDFGIDSSRAFNESGAAALPVNNSAQPYASGGTTANGSLTEDFIALSGGLTYRSELWSWNGRAETRDGETRNRYGFSTGFLRQAQAGVAYSLNAQGFHVSQASGPEGLYGTAGMGWAYRPLDSRWSVLDRLELRYDQLVNGTGTAGSGLFGNTSLVATGDALSRRLINNLSVNRVSREWNAEDRQGNLFELAQRNQWSLYYGAKYAFDRFDGANYQGYTDLTGGEWRFDLNTWIDLGVQAGLLHAWQADNYRYSFGPQLGVSPVTNGWITLGYNLQGFRDRDFEAARYSTQGPYLTLRIKFDQATRLREVMP